MSAKSTHKGLGRGLESLLGPSMPEDVDVLTDISVEAIDPNPNQPRKKFDKDKLEELAGSIKSVGVLNPILVYKDNGRYTIIAGERRWRASRLAGLSTIPAIVRRYDAVMRMQAALIENLQRDDLNAIEEAEGIRALMEECALTQEDAAARIGRSRPAVANLLRLLTLDDATMEDVRAGRLSQGHARALLSVGDVALRRQLAQKAIAGQWSVRHTEEAAAALSHPSAPQRQTPARHEDFDAMQLAFKKALGSKVVVSGTRKKGRINIYYDSFEEFERIFNIINDKNG